MLLSLELHMASEKVKLCWKKGVETGEERGKRVTVQIYYYYCLLNYLPSEMEILQYLAPCQSVNNKKS